MSKRLWLKTAAGFSFFMAICQTVISLSPAVAAYFGAPPPLLENRLQLFLIGNGATLIFAVFGLYALSGAGSIRHLPLLRLGLIGISNIYLLRGLFIILTVLAILGVIEGETPIQGVISHLVFLGAGIAYAVGTVLNWREMQIRSESFPYSIQSRKEQAMDKNILVTYASKYGATKEIAEKIGEVLRQADLQADVLPVDNIRDINLYKVIILGSAVYVGQWHKKAVGFLQTNEKILAARPVWLFSSGPTGEGDPVELLDGWHLPAVLQPVADRVHPRDIAVFHGHINPDKINLIEKWAVKSLVKKPFGDFRDWDMITGWARSIADTLKDRDAERPSLRYLST